jgi:[ribosomal protein S5]-alanine N-acetyltransferase
LGAHVPTDLVREPKVLEFAAARLAENANYLPWSARALILKATKEMIGHLRFNTLPDPDYLKPYAHDVVEFGYVIFCAHRRRGYAFEAAVGAMDWAKTRGVRNFIVTVSPNNAPSLGLVAKAGFRKIGEHIDEVDGLELILLKDKVS